MRAHAIVAEFIERTARSLSFLQKTGVYLSKMYVIRNRLTNNILRRRYKKQILREYWRMIVDRCQRL